MARWFALLLLAGCASAPTVEDYAASCDQYGFTRGTEWHAQCVQALAVAQIQAASARSARLQAAGAALMQQGQAMNARAAAQRPRTTWCYPSGNAMFCQ